MYIKWDEVANVILTHKTPMLIGEYIHTLDPKKRIALPAKFRKELGKSGDHARVGQLFVCVSNEDMAKGF